MIMLAVIAPFSVLIAKCPKNMENQETVRNCFKFKGLILSYNLHFNCTNLC